MTVSALRDEVARAAVDFAWGQWAQIGVLADTERRDRWAADPEALLLFSLEAGRSDPRLFDELLDWMLVNERQISVQRLRNLCRDGEDRALAEAALAWVARTRPRRRLAGAASPQREPQPLFRRLRRAPRRADEAFLEYGFVRGMVEPAGKSRAPDPYAPINLAFRLRQILGLGARAEVVRFLLTVGAPHVTAQVVAEAAGYAKRNVRDALVSLRTAGVVEGWRVGNELRYGIDRPRWASLLGTTADDLPLHRDWPQLLAAIRRLMRWLEDPSSQQLSDYLRASEARALMDELSDDLRFAGVRLPAGLDAAGAAYWSYFEEAVRAGLRALDEGL